MTSNRPDWLQVHQGNAPLLISLPHTGTILPPEIDDGRLVSTPRALRDTDWYIDQLYGFARAMGITSVRSTISRTVIDLNRDPSGVSLYPGQATTGLCPTETFDGEQLYCEGRAPDEAEIADRRERWFMPYHQALEAEIARLRLMHRKIVVYDCHSIRSIVPRLFAGVLPHFNIGTNDGQACSPELQEIVARACKHKPYSSVTNGRFKGGWITRHYGAPFLGVEAVQMELACRGYMRETASDEPEPYDPEFAEPMIGILKSLFEAIIQYCQT